MHKDEAVDGAWVDGSYSSNIISKSSEKFMLLEFKWKTTDNGNTYQNKNPFLDSYIFFSKSLSQLIQVQKSNVFNSFPSLSSTS